MVSASTGYYESHDSFALRTQLPRRVLFRPPFRNQSAPSITQSYVIRPASSRLSISSARKLTQREKRVRAHAIGVSQFSVEMRRRRGESLLHAFFHVSQRWTTFAGATAKRRE